MSAVPPVTGGAGGAGAARPAGGGWGSCPRPRAPAGRQQAGRRTARRQPAAGREAPGRDWPAGKAAPRRAPLAGAGGTGAGRSCETREPCSPLARRETGRALAHPRPGTALRSRRACCGAAAGGLGAAASSARSARVPELPFETRSGGVAPERGRCASLGPPQLATMQFVAVPL